MTRISRFVTCLLTALLVAATITAASPNMANGQDGSPVAADFDLDGVPDELDNCFDGSNPDQLDSDGDGLGDACDPTPNGETDGDGVDELTDLCPGFDDAIDADGNG